MASEQQRQSDAKGCPRYGKKAALVDLRIGPRVERGHGKQDDSRDGVSYVLGDPPPRERRDEASGWFARPTAVRPQVNTSAGI